MNVRLSKEQKTQILNSEDLYNIMQQVLLRQNKIRRNQEFLWVAGLDNASNLLFVELIALGGNNRVNVSPPEIFRVAIYKLASRIILIHNHPSGNLQPSKPDLNFTDKMMKAGKLAVDIEVLDHLIINEETYISLAAEGIMKDLENNGRYKLIDKERESLEKLKIQVAEDRAKKEQAKDIARKMKENGYSVAEIQKITGLRKDVISRL